MNKSRGINLIIQGPIFSPGVNGKGKKVDYNCVNNINQILNKYKHLFEHIVLATWIKEDISAIDRHKNLHIIQVEDIGGDFKRASCFWGMENIKRQFLSTWAAVDYLNKLIKKTDLLVKLRTDQLVDLNLLVDELKKIYTSGSDKIVIPCINRKYVYPNDYFWAGSLNRMQKFLSAQLYSMSPLYNAHESMIYNYKSHDESMVLSEFNLFMNLVFWNKRKRARRIFENYNIFSKEIIKTCRWRGEYVKDSNQRQFDYECPNTDFDFDFHVRKYINIKRYISAVILKRKHSKKRLKRLIDIMENKNKEMIIAV